MATLYKLCQQLWLQKFHNSVYHTCKISTNLKRIFPLNELVMNKTVYEKILNPNLSNKDWKSIRENVLQQDEVTEITVDNIIMDICIKYRNLDQATMYFKFLRNNNYPLNALIISKYMRLYSLKSKELSDEEKKDIVDTYEALRKMYPNLDGRTSEYCVTSLCLTDQWEKTKEIIDMMKITTEPSSIVYSSVADAAFRHGKPAIAWNALSETLQRKLLPLPIAYNGHVQYCKQGGTEFFDKRLEEMFSFFIDNTIMSREQVIKQYAKVAGEYGWSATNTDINKEGKCSKCSQFLSDITISEKDFRQLMESVKQNVIVGQHIYLKTNPQELQLFMNFINRSKPFDIVIDGLNLMYIKKKASYQTLAKVIEHFSCKRRQKVLVLTRKHQRKDDIFNYIQKYAYFFMVNNLSSDDVYLLYATMASGNKAKFVSLDLMRQHKYLLNDIHLERIFKKWQLSHQYFVKVQANKIKIQDPFTLMPYVQKNNDSWHIPYIDDNCTTLESYEFPNKWYCFHKKRQKS